MVPTQLRIRMPPSPKDVKQLRRQLIPAAPAPAAEGPAAPAPGGAMLISTPMFRDAAEKKSYLEAFRRVFRTRSAPDPAPHAAEQQLLHSDIVSALNAPATDFGPILVQDPVIHHLARQGLLRPLDTVFPDADRRFTPAGLRRCVVDGVLYGAPLRNAARLLFYRKDLLEKHGLRPPRNFGELEQAGRTVVEREKRARLRGLALHAPPYALFQLLLEQLWFQGQDLYLERGRWAFNAAGVAAALRRLHRCFHDERMAGMGSLRSGAWESVADFLEGRAVFLLHTTDTFKVMHERGSDTARTFAWCTLPGGAGLISGAAYVVPARTRHWEGAARALKVLFEAESQARLDLAAGWPFPSLRELYLSARTMARKPYYRLAELAFTQGRLLEELPYLAGNPVLWEKTAALVLDPLFKRPAQPRDFPAAAEELKARLAPLLPKAAYTGLVARAVDSIQRDLSREHSVQSLARELGVSRGHLIRQFKLATRTTPLRYMNEARVEKAKELLAMSSYKVGEVGRQVGFKTIFHFSKVFRQIAGRNPSEFKRGRPGPAA
jgi:AraC-like DNA-binding protein/ABC-type glycerol-3-phosphate transport system substrate-binding protein